MEQDNNMYNILIIDDNPFPFKQLAKVLLHKLHNKFDAQCTYDNIEKKFSNTCFNNLKTKYCNIGGQSINFSIGNCNLILYNYEAKHTVEKNRDNIIELVKENKVNILWADRGFIPIILEENSLFKDDDEYTSASIMDLLNDEKLLIKFEENCLRQFAIYTYDPNVTPREIEQRQQEISSKFKDGKGETPSIHYIDTSTIFNLFEPSDFLSDGQSPDNFLGTISAFEQYGKLIGHVLYDLFMWLPENKAKFSPDEKRYNFFNGLNSSFLGHVKLINNHLLKDGFKIGLVSYYSEFRDTKHFLLDVPYKEYYSEYDEQLGDVNDSESIAFIFNLEKKGANLDNGIEHNISGEVDYNNSNTEGYMYFKYKANKNNNDFDFTFQTRNIKEPDSSDKFEKYLHLLHTAIFYQPDYYLKGKYGFNFNRFKHGKVFTNTSDKRCCEIYYLIKNVNLSGIPGTIHFTLWRRQFTPKNDIGFKVEQFWKFYYPFIEAKIEETLLPLLISELSKQSLQIATASIFARNYAHHIGSHVKNQAFLPEIRERINHL